MVIMNDDLWTKIVDNLYGMDEVLTQRMDNEAITISEADKQYVMNMLTEDYNQRNYGISREESLKVQDRHYVGTQKAAMDIDNRVWCALHDCKEE